MSDYCDEYLAQLYSYLDGELSDEQALALQAHLEDCPPCLDEFHRDQLLKALVRRSCACEPAPQALRAQIMTTITTVEVTTTTVRIEP